MNGATSVTGGPCVGHSVENPRALILSRLAKYCRIFPSGGEITVVDHPMMWSPENSAASSFSA